MPFNAVYWVSQATGLPLGKILSTSRTLIYFVGYMMWLYFIPSLNFIFFCFWIL